MQSCMLCIACYCSTAYAMPSLQLCTRVVLLPVHWQTVSPGCR